MNGNVPSDRDRPAGETRPAEDTAPIENSTPVESAPPPGYTMPAEPVAPPAGPPAPYPPMGPPFAVPVPPAPRRRRARILVPAGLIAVLGILVAVSIVLTNSHAGKPGTAAQHAGSSPSGSPSPTGPPLTPEAYQAALDTSTTGLGKVFAGLNDAHTPVAVSAALNTLHATLVIGLETLKTLFPPEAVREQHRALVTELNNLGSAVLLAEGSTSSNQLCGGSSAASQIAGSAGGLRTAIAALATADPAHAYKVAQFLPPSGPNANRQLNNGNLIKRPGRGPNTVKVENKYPNDVVISMAPAGSKNASLIMYVRSGQTASATSVPDGTYDVFMARGTDWDGGSKTFTRDCAYEKFDQTVALKSTSRQYTVETFTLGVADGGGNLKGADADPGTFPG